MMTQAKILNGKIIPGDRVFYPVKSHIRGSVPKDEKNNLNGKLDLSLVVTDANEQSESSWYSSITSMIGRERWHNC